MNRKMLMEMARFVLVGGVATLLHYGIYYVLMQVMWPTLAYALGYAFSFVFNFFATTFFTFRTALSWKRLLGMMGAHGVNFGVHILLFQLFLWVGMDKTWIPVPVYAVAIPLNFLLVRYVFTSPNIHS